MNAHIENITGKPASSSMRESVVFHIVGTIGKRWSITMIDCQVAELLIDCLTVHLFEEYPKMIFFCLQIFYSLLF